MGAARRAGGATRDEQEDRRRYIALDQKVFLKRLKKMTKKGKLPKKRTIKKRKKYLKNKMSLEKVQKNGVYSKRENHSKKLLKRAAQKSELAHKILTKKI